MLDSTYLYNCFCYKALKGLLCRIPWPHWNHIFLWPAGCQSNRRLTQLWGVSLKCKLPINFTCRVSQSGGRKKNVTTQDNGLISRRSCCRVPESRTELNIFFSKIFFVPVNVVFFCLDFWFPAYLLSSFFVFLCFFASPLFLAGLFLCFSFFVVFPFFSFFVFFFVSLIFCFYVFLFLCLFASLVFSFSSLSAFPDSLFLYFFLFPAFVLACFFVFPYFSFVSFVLNNAWKTKTSYHIIHTP